MLVINKCICIFTKLNIFKGFELTACQNLPRKMFQVENKSCRTDASQSSERTESLVNVNNWLLSSKAIWVGRLKHRFRIREMEDQELQDCENVFAFQDQKTGFDPFLSYVGDLKENPDKNVIVMDNGEYCILIKLIYLLISLVCKWNIYGSLF